MSVFSVFTLVFKTVLMGFPGGAVNTNLPAYVGEMGSIPGLGGSRMS